METPGFMSNNPFLGFLVASLFVFFLTSCDAFNKTSEQYLSASQAYFNKGEYAASLIEIKNAIQQNPTNPALREFLAQVYLQLGKAINAEAALNKAVTLGADKNLLTPLQAQVLFELHHYQQLIALKVPQSLAANDQATVIAYQGFASAERNDSKAARLLYQQSLAMDADNLLAQRGIILLYVAQGNSAQALQVINKLIKKHPHNSELMTLQGDVYVSNHQFNDALASYTNAAESSQGNRYLNIAKRALACLSKEDMECANKDLSQLEKNAPGYFMTTYVKGLVAIKQQRWKDAQSAMTDTLALNSRLTPAYYFSGVTLYKQKQYGSAITHLSRFVAHQSDSVNGRHLLSLAQFQEGYLESAKTTLQPIIKNDKANPSILFLLGQIEYAMGDIDDSITHFKQVSELQPESALAHAQLGIKLMASGDQSGGLDELAVAIDLAPDLLEVGHASVLAYLDANQFDKAQALITKMRDTNPDSAELLNLQALLYLQKGEPKHAKNFFRQALQQADGDPTASHNLARLMFKQGDVQKTIQLYQNVLNHHPKHIQSHLKLAEFDLKLGNEIKAEQRLLNLMTQQPNALGPRLMLAQYYLISGRVEALTEMLESVSRIYPKDQRLLKLSAEGYLASGLLGQAKRAAQSLVDQTPDSAISHWLVARVAFAANNKLIGEKELKQTLLLKPDHIPAQIVNIKMLAENQQNKQAVAHLLKLIKQASGDPRVMSAAAWLAMDTNDFTRAISLYSKAFSYSATSENALGLAKAQWQTGQHENANTTLQDWTINHPDDVSAQFRLAMCYQQMGLDGDATARFARVLQFEPDNVVALNNLAWLLRNEDSVKALQYIEKATELEPDSAALLDTLGMVLLRKGEIVRALRVFQRTTQANPDHAVTQYHYAIALHRNNKTRRAIEILEHLIVAYPDFNEKDNAQMLLGKLKMSYSISG
jgi:putative PEP-CTERM system TPR-repeat lipoprotein